MTNRLFIGVFRMGVAALVCCAQLNAVAGDLRFVQVASTSNPSVADFTKSLNRGIERKRVANTA